MKRKKNIIIGHKITRTLPEERPKHAASELKHDKRTNGIGALSWASPVRVYDAATGQLKYTIENPPTFDQLIQKGLTSIRVHTRRNGGRN